MQLTKDLISCQQLYANLNQPNLIILDASIPPVANMSPPENTWPEHALPNAQFFDIEQQFSDKNTKQPPSKDGGLKPAD